MPSWVPSLKPPRSKMAQATHAAALAEVRLFYETQAAGFAKAPDDIEVQAEEAGEIKGEWVRAQGSEDERMILYLHGGGFVAGSPESHRALVARLCKASGATAFSLDYRLAPEFPFPAGLRDAIECYRLLLDNGVTPQSIVIAGDEAGGGLAFSTVMAIRKAELPMPAACVALSPWADLSLSGWSMLQHSDNDTVMCWENLFVAARHYLDGANPGEAFISPAFGNLKGFPPIMVHAGSLELLRDDASRLGELAAKANIAVSVEIYDGQAHLFQTSNSGNANASLSRIGQFIQARAQARSETESGKRAGSA